MACVDNMNVLSLISEGYVGNNLNSSLKQARVLSRAWEMELDLTPLTFSKFQVSNYIDPKIDFFWLNPNYEHQDPPIRLDQHITNTIHQYDPYPLNIL